MSRDDDIRKGDRAAQLLQDEVLTEAFANLERDCIAEWRNSPARDIDGREKIWQLLKQVDSVKNELKRFISEGDMAKRMVGDENKRREVERKAKEEVAAQLGIPVSMIEDDV